MAGVGECVMVGVGECVMVGVGECVERIGVAPVGRQPRRGCARARGSWL